MPICACESTGRKDGIPTHYESDGITVLKGRVNPDDRGQCQINRKFWLDLSNKLGYDIDNYDGNILMANYIYENYGTKPWTWSFKCWSDSV